MSENIKDSYTAVIDFDKVLISISSTILAALISYLVFQDYDLNFPNLIAPILLVVSLFLSLLGFGQAIPAIKKNQSRKLAVKASNLAAVAMFLGIFAIGLIRQKSTPTINEVLVQIENTSETLKTDLSAVNCNQIEFVNRNYILSYELDSLKVKIIYSLDDKKMTLFDKKIQKRFTKKRCRRR